MQNDHLELRSKVSRRTRVHIPARKGSRLSVPKFKTPSSQLDVFVEGPVPTDPPHQLWCMPPQPERVIKCKRFDFF